MKTLINMEKHKMEQYKYKSVPEFLFSANSRKARSPANIHREEKNSDGSKLIMEPGCSCKSGHQEESNIHMHPSMDKNRNTNTTHGSSDLCPDINLDSGFKGKKTSVKDTDSKGSLRRKNSHLGARQVVSSINSSFHGMDTSNLEYVQNDSTVNSFPIVNYTESPTVNPSLIPNLPHTTLSLPPQLDDRVILNIGGTQFTTYWSTLQAIPGTRLADLTSEDPAYDKHRDEYFFDRNAGIFQYILDLYREGELHVPQCVCAPVIRRELLFWGIPDSYMSSLCCMKTFADYEESCKTLDEIQQAFRAEEPPSHTTSHLQCGTPWFDKFNRWKIKLWIFLEDPNSSAFAKLWALFFVLLLIGSVMVVCLDSLPSFRIPVDRNDPNSILHIDPSYNLSNSLVSDNPKLTMYLTTIQHPAMFYVNHCCSVFFGVELLIRFLVCPYKRKFLKSFFNVIDVLAVVPTAAASIVSLIDLRLWLQHDLTFNYIFFTFTSIFRAIRIVKLMKHYRGLRVMFLALKASSPEMLLLTLLLTIAVIIFSTTIYFTELHHPNSFPSIPVGFWWSVVTMTTVGYGDAIPQTAGGYVVGALCAISGMLITGLPIPVMANNFRLYYTYAKLHGKLQARLLNQGGRKFPSLNCITGGASGRKISEYEYTPASTTKADETRNNNIQHHDDQVELDL